MNNLEPEMMPVPASYFVRGVRAEDAYEDEESPQLKVWVKEFRVQRWPVTVKQWLQFLDDSRYLWSKEEWLRVLREKYSSVEPPDDAPITWVNWHDCTAFAHWLSSSLGKKYSLPTEDQWEKACRGSDGGRFPWGNENADWKEAFFRESDLEGNIFLQSVGQHKDKASPFGAEDMWCNVQEWCEDWFLEDWTDPESPDNEPPGLYKVVRGGNPITPGWPRCTARQRVELTYRSHILGFRLVSED